MSAVPPARHLLRAKDLADARYSEPLRAWSGRPAAFSSVSLVLDAHDGARREHALNDAPKYVASDTAEPLARPKSMLLTGDVPKAVVELEGNREATCTSCGAEC